MKTTIITGVVVATILLFTPVEEWICAVVPMWIIATIPFIFVGLMFWGLVHVAKLAEEAYFARKRAEDVD
jgi:hypothetical protein